MSNIGDNGGPPIEKWTAARKLERIKEIMLTGMSAAQKCIGVGIVVHADKDGVAVEMSTALLQTIASVKDRETVYRATERLEREEVAAKHRVDGRPNNYSVMSPRVLQEIEDAFHARTSPVEPDGVVGLNPTGAGGPTSRVEPDGVVGSNPTGVGGDTRRVEPDMRVGLNPTSPVEPVGLNPTGAGDDAPAPAPPRGIARAQSIYINNNNLAQNQNLTPPHPSEQEAAPAGGEGTADAVIVNCVSITGPGFKIDLKAIDQIAMLTGMPSERARALAEIHAREWAANGTKPNYPMAFLKKAITGDKNDEAINEVRLARAQAGPQRQTAAAPPDGLSRRQRLSKWADELPEDTRGKRK